jgi:GLPGLI family protein
MVECGIKKFGIALGLLLITSVSYAQMVTTGRIVYERKTNLEKRLGDNPRMKDFINDDNKYRIEDFELYFNDTMSVFRPLPTEDEAQGFMKYMTTHNTVYQNISSREKYIIMDLWGNETYLKDSLQERTWKITESKRKLGGYMCRKAIWEMNDSTRFYAWFSTDVVPAVGPEGFEGLPGAIMGLAVEDGSVIYFAKEVEAMKPPEGVLTYKEAKDVYSEEELKEILMERMGRWVKPKDLDAMFEWL